MATAELQPAVIDRCYSKFVKRGSARVSVYGPVAITEQGLEVKGGFTRRPKEKCTGSIGKQVSVFVHPTQERFHRIHTFFQFWFFPLIFGLGSAIFYPLLYKAKKVKDAKNQDDH